MRSNAFSARDKHKRYCQDGEWGRAMHGRNIWIDRRRITIFAVVVLAMAGLGGCELFLEAGALEGAGVGMEAAEAGGLAAAGEAGVAATEVADLGVSYDLVEDAQLRASEGAQRGQLTEAFSRLTDQGRGRGTMRLNGRGQLFAAEKPVATINRATGRIYAGNRLIGYLDGDSAGDGLIHEYLRDGGTQPVARMEGFIAENGAEFRPNPDGSTGLRVLRSDVSLDVIGIRDNFYLVRLPGGEMGLVPIGAFSSVALLALAQKDRRCLDDKSRAVGWLGVQTNEVTDNQARAFGLASGNGAFVNGVVSGSPASRAGLAPGDVISTLNGEAIHGAQRFHDSLVLLHPGDEIELVVLRQTGAVTVQVSLGERERPGAVILKSGELVRFERCEVENGATILHASDGDTIVDAAYADSTLTGDGVPGVTDEQAHVEVASIAARSGYVFANRPGATPGEGVPEFAGVDYRQVAGQYGRIDFSRVPGGRLDWMNSGSQGFSASDRSYSPPARQSREYYALRPPPRFARPGFQHRYYAPPSFHMTRPMRPWNGGSLRPNPPVHRYPAMSSMRPWNGGNVRLNPPMHRYPAIPPMRNGDGSRARPTWYSRPVVRRNR
jgi:hypothetical protein